MYRIEFKAMGCQMLAILDSTAANGQEKLDRVPAWFEEWEQVLSRFRTDSELSCLNRSPHQAVSVSPTLWEVFRAAQTAEQRSGGLVTPLVYTALVTAGYDRSFDELEENGTPVNDHEIPAIGVLESVELDLAARTLTLPAGARLDFGGVAKGWAANEAVNRLKAYGPALVDAGGDIAVSGLRSDGQPWPIEIADPMEPEGALAMLKLGRNGVATSGKDYRHWMQNGKARHHIIDPRTSAPADTDVLAATIVAPSVLEAETAAKTALILGGDEGLNWLEAQNGLAGVLALDDGEVLFSRRMDQYLWS